MTSTITINKNQANAENYREFQRLFPRARDAFGVLLELLNADGYTLLLPAYIGISPKEGSGLFDPVTQTGIPYQFYRMDRDLHIDLAELDSCLRKVKGKKALLLVHYWGYTDPQYKSVISMAKEQGCFVIEDLAHAFFTDYIDHSCGRECDASFYALHKMFPMQNGGVLKIQNREFATERLKEEYSYPGVFFPYFYDYYAIAQRRKANAAIWHRLISNMPETFEILRPLVLLADNTPQTFPVRLLQGDRFSLYNRLNERGYGIVSLYHTMIPPIQEGNYPASMELSSRILNLPVHQDVTEENICDMFRAICEEVKK